MTIGCIEDSNMKNAMAKDSVRKYMIKPNNVFNVPLEWLKNDKCILYQKEKEKYKTMELLVYNCASTLLTNHKGEPNISYRAQYLPYKVNDREDINFACDVYAFKCKPLDLKVPLQVLMSFNPPMCYKNLLFGDLILQRESDKHQLLKLKPEEYNYIYDTIQLNTNPKDKQKIGMPKYSWYFQKD